MILAKNRHGQIGRQVPGPGLQARVSPSPIGDERGSVYLSTRSLEADQARYMAEEIAAKKKQQQERIRSVAKRVAEEARKNAQAQKVIAFQKLAMLDPMNERLKAHYARTKSMGESEAVVASLLRNPADFSSQGGNPQIVASEDGKRPIAYFADFRQKLIVGNPLTRNGEFGPAVTDYDRYVNGTDVNQSDVVEIAGGTILGRDNGGIPVPAGLAGKSRPMGSWYDDLITGASNVIKETGSELATQLPGQLADELNDAIFQGGQVTSQTGGTIVVQRQVPGTTTTQMVSGVPNWVLYAGGGLLAMGFLLVLVKAVKS
jgi:hypothetical protein